MAGDARNDLWGGLFRNDLWGGLFIGWIIRGILDHRASMPKLRISLFWQNSA